MRLRIRLERWLPSLRRNARELDAAILRLAIADVHSPANSIAPHAYTAFLRRTNELLCTLADSNAGKVVAFDVANWTIALPGRQNKNLEPCAYALAIRCLQSFDGLAKEELPECAVQMFVGIAIGRVILSSGNSPTAILGETVNRASTVLRAACHIRSSLLAAEEYGFERAKRRELPGPSGEMFTVFEWPVE